MAHLESGRGNFPKMLYEVASSEWYYNFEDPRCPHDAVLEEARLNETIRGDELGVRQVALKIKLQSFHYDDIVDYTFYYPEVFSYRIDSSHRSLGQRTWRYDEFRLSDEGGVLHEIEWAGTGNWLIEASDVQFRCVVRPNAQAHK